MRKEFVFLGTFAVMAISAGPEARACGFVDYRGSEPDARQAPKPPPTSASDRMVVAEQRLEQERLPEAGSQALAAFPNVRTADVGSSPLETRAARILALALVRSNGALAGATAMSKLRTGPPVSSQDSRTLTTFSRYDRVQIRRRNTGRHRPPEKESRRSDGQT